MQRTYYNTKVATGGGAQSTKAGTSPLGRTSPTRLAASTIDAGSGGAEATTDAASSAAALLRTTRFGAKGAVGFGKGGAGPACNYQNVDLFRIPDGMPIGKK